MNVKKVAKIYGIIAIITIVISLVPSLIVLAIGSEQTTGADGKTYTYSTSDDGTDGPDVTTLRFELTGYGGYQLGSGKTDNDFTTNSKYGWREFEKDGQRYVVFAAATHEMLNANKGRSGTYWFYGAKFDHIHYFHYNDTIQFKFEDESFDSQVYNGIMLDSGDAMMFPQHSLYKRESGINMLDVYFGTNGESDSRIGTISGKVILATMDGTFSSNAGTTNSQSKKDMIIEFFYGLCHGLGDGIQMALNYAGTSMSWKDCKKLTYKRADIEANKKLNKQIQVEDAKSKTENTEEASEESETEYNTIKEANILSSADNRQGQKETIYTKDTEIPVMPIDLYSSSIDKVELFDIDFFNTKSSNKNKFWKGIRAFVSGTSHIVMYIAAALLLTMLIWRSILLVRSALGDNPQGAYESRQIMDNFIKSVLIISCVYLAMITMIYLYKQLLKIFLNGNNSIYLIRVNVEGVYSFNTNIIGYLKYMTLNSNIYAAFGYSIIYAIVQIFNLFWFGFMLIIRSGAMIVMTIIAPLTAVYSMRGRTPTNGTNSRNLLNFGRFIRFYIIVLFLPLVVAGIQKVIMFIS